MNYAAPRAPVSWPHQVGTIPRQADSFQHRDAADVLERATATGETAAVQVLTGTGGVGKTQLAAHCARGSQRAGSVDLLVWATATSRDTVQNAYAQAGVDVAEADPGDPGRAADRFLAWAQTTDRRWLIVLDDVTDPADLRGLWPPSNPRGRVLLTTRRRDASLTGPGRHRIDVGLFAPDEAISYLGTALAAHGRQDDPADLAGLAGDLGYLPLALAQAAAYLVDLGLDCGAYRRRLADHDRRLPDLVPEDSGLPDDQRATVAATWSLSIEHADRLRPRGLARPMLHLTSMLDPNGIPAAVLTGPEALAYLTAHRTRGTDGKDTERAAPISSEDATEALRGLHRLSLADHSPDSPHQTVRVHRLIQRAMRETATPDQRDELARTGAAALLSAWPEVERDPDLAQSLRTNTVTLTGLAGVALWQAGGHDVLFRAGRSLADAGLHSAARGYFEDLSATADRLLGAEHRDTLRARGDLAQCRGVTGDVAGAVAAMEVVAEDMARVLGRDDPETLLTRDRFAEWLGESGHPRDAAVATEAVLARCLEVLGAEHSTTLRARGDLAHWRGLSGDVAGAAADTERLVGESTRVLGKDHPYTLRARGELANLRGASGHLVDAVTATEELVADCRSVLGKDHPMTLAARGGLAYWVGQTGNPKAAVAATAEVVADLTRVLGADHPTTLATRGNLASWRAEAGDLTGAVADTTALLANCRRLLGPDHPQTLAVRAGLAYVTAWGVGAVNPADAVTTVKRLLGDCLRVFGPDHPQTLAVRQLLALWYGNAGDTAGAIAELEALVTKRRRVLGAGHLQTLATSVDLANRLGQAGDPGRAVATLEELVGDYERLFGSGHPQTLWARRCLADWRGNAGDPSGAAAAYEDLVEDVQRAFGPGHPQAVLTCGSLVYWRLAAGELDDAVTVFQGLLDDCRRTLGPEDFRTLAVRGDLANQVGEEGDPPGAVAALRELAGDCEQVLGQDHPLTLAVRDSLVRWQGV